jgi:hypothetical protein
MVGVIAHEARLDLIASLRRVAFPLRLNELLPAGRDDAAASFQTAFIP